MWKEGDRAAADYARVWKTTAEVLAGRERLTAVFNLGAGVDVVLDTGKTLRTIFISNADPDYYLGTEMLKRLLPQAQVLTTPAVCEKIQAKMAGQLFDLNAGGNAMRCNMQIIADH